MSLFKIFDIAGSATAAQSTRMNVIASNMANSDSIASSPESVYQQKLPVFKARTQFSDFLSMKNVPRVEGIEVHVSKVIENKRDPLRQHNPGHPFADEEGYVYAPNISAVEEMTSMIAASKSYQMNVQVMDTAKQLLLRTLRLGE